MCQVLRLQKASNIDCYRKGILSFLELKNFKQKVFISINLSLHGDSSPLLLYLGGFCHPVNISSSSKSENSG